MSLSRTIFTACATSLIAIGAFAAQPEGLQGVAAAERYRGAQEGVEAIKLDAIQPAAPVAGAVSAAHGVQAASTESQVKIGWNAEAQRYIGGNAEAQRYIGGNVEAQRYIGGNVEAQRAHIGI